MSPAPCWPLLGPCCCAWWWCLSARIAIRRAAVNVAFDLRRALFDRLQRQGLAFFGQHTVGDMMTRAVSDIGVLRRLVSLGTIFLVIMVYATAVGFAAMFYLALDLAWLVFPPLPFIAVYALFAARSMRAASEATQETLGMALSGPRKPSGAYARSRPWLGSPS